MRNRKWNLIYAGIISLFLISTGCSDKSKRINWTQKHIADVPSIIMKDPFLELLGQVDRPIPYTYEEVVKLSGHSCAAVAGAWIITKKALEALYPDEIPVRGQIKIYAPGADDEWLVGVFGEVITYITGASPGTGFPGAAFGKSYNRRNLLKYKDAITNTLPFKMAWIFERVDTGVQVSVRYNLTMIKPPATPEKMKMASKMAYGKASVEEVKEWKKFWNERVKFVFENADTLEGFFTVNDLKTSSSKQ